MSQTSHVGAIISTGTAYKAAVGETVARGERTMARRDAAEGRRESGKRIVIQRRAEAFPRAVQPPRPRDLNVKRA